MICLEFYQKTILNFIIDKIDQTGEIDQLLKINRINFIFLDF